MKWPRDPEVVKVIESREIGGKQVKTAMRKPIISISLFMLYFLVQFPVFSEELSTEQQKIIREQIEKSKREEEKKAEEREKAAHPEVAPVLYELEGAYAQDGEEAAWKFANKHRLSMLEDNKVGVHLFFKKGLSGKFFDVSVLLDNDCLVVGREKSYVAVYMPINKITKISETLTGITYEQKGPT